MSDSANEGAGPLLDRELVDQIKSIGHATGRNDLLPGFVAKLENNIAAFPKSFSDCMARGDAAGAARAVHSLKGASRQLGARALGDLFADIERSAKAGDYAEAQRKFEGGATLIAQTLEALKRE